VFTAEVLSAQGGGHAVVVPKDVAATFSSKRPPVLAHINGVEYRSRLMIYGGQCYLGLRKDLLRLLDVGAGDHIEIELVEGVVKLTLTHSMERESSRFIDAVSGGWPQILSNLKSLLETGAVVLGPKYLSKEQTR